MKASFIKGGMLSLILAMSLSSMAVMAQTTKTNEAKPQAATANDKALEQSKAKFLFVQNAGEAVVEKVSGEGKNAVYKVTLKKINPYVAFFTERPNRKAGLIPTEKYMQQWEKAGSNGFRENQPNAFLHAVQTSVDENKKPINIAVEISNPVHDAQAQTFTYTVKILDGNSSNEMPKNLQYVTLFIDDDVCLTCW